MLFEYFVGHIKWQKKYTKKLMKCLKLDEEERYRWMNGSRESEVVGGYCSAVSSAPVDSPSPPLSRGETPS